MVDVKVFDVVEKIGNLIQNNISDPAGKSRWVFPTFATNKSNLPQVTVKLLQTSFEDDSADSFLGSEVVSDETTIKYREYYYKKAITPANLYLLTGKQQEYTIDGLFLTGQPLNSYLTNKIKLLLFKEQENSNTFQDDFERVKVLGIDPAFRDDENTWASEVQIEVTYKDVWVKEYVDGDLVSEYSLTVNTY